MPVTGTSAARNEDGTRLTLQIARGGIKWHDGAPFSAADVKCTWNLLTGRAAERHGDSNRRQNLVRTRLFAGGSRIRTLGPA
jgi:peptide/nickel transport system substrate-binding protein